MKLLIFLHFPTIDENTTLKKYIASFYINKYISTATKKILTPLMIDLPIVVIQYNTRKYFIGDCMKHLYYLLHFLFSTF